MKPIVLVIQNEIDDPVALVGEWINEVGVEVEVVHAYRGETVPAVLPAHISGAWRKSPAMNWRPVFDN